jgi:hypothetical protein
MTLGVCPKTREILFNITSDEYLEMPPYLKWQSSTYPDPLQKFSWMEPVTAM